jgi:hypothetical protein
MGRAALPVAVAVLPAYQPGLAPAAFVILAFQFRINLPFIVNRPRAEAIEKALTKQQAAHGCPPKARSGPAGWGRPPGGYVGIECGQLPVDT